MPAAETSDGYMVWTSCPSSPTLWDEADCTGPRLLTRTSEWPRLTFRSGAFNGQSDPLSLRFMAPYGRVQMLVPEVRAVTCSSFFSLADLWDGLELSAFFELSASHILAGKVRPLNFLACGSE